jgi:inner membrane protein
MSAAWAVSGRPRHPEWIQQSLVLCTVSLLPDIDLLFGIHSGPTHSIGAAMIVGLAAWAMRRLAHMSTSWPAPWAVVCAYASHILLDWLGADTSAPYGVMALWPFTERFFISPVAMMPSITRRYWLPGFWEHNARALLFEICVLGPVWIAVWWGRRARADDRSHAAPDNAPAASRRV